jgi:hypothetical protein
LTPDAKALLAAWAKTFDQKAANATRVVEMVKRLLIVLAVTNLPVDHKGSVSMVDVDLMTQATQFGTYLLAVREMVNVVDSWGPTQSMENAIIKWYRENASKTNPKNMRDCRRGLRPERMVGGLGTFATAFKNAIIVQVLKPRGSNRSGSPLYYV